MSKGTLYLTIANVIFLLCGYAIHLGLGRYLGPASYGTFGVVLTLMNTVTLVLTSGFPDAASKYIAEDNAKLSSIIRSSRTIQAVLSIPLFALYFGLAGTIANALHDPGLTRYIRISALAIPLYALYQVYSSGYLNGLRRFGQQAKVLILSSLVRVGVAFGLIYLLELGIEGAILGYLAAAALGLILARQFLGSVPKDSATFEWRKLISFGVPAMLFAITLFLMMSIDLFAVKAICRSDNATGYYTAATTIAKAPYYILGGLPLTLLPVISMSTSMNNRGLTTIYISQSIRYMLILVVPCTFLISATSGDLFSLIYTSGYVEAAKPLELLVFGIAFLTVFLVLSQIIIASGKPRVAFGIALTSLAIDITLNITLIPRYGLVGAAWATTLTALVGMIAAALYVFRRFKTLVSAKSFIKICLAALAVYVVALKLPIPSVSLPFVYVGLLAIYFALLLLMREIGKKDFETLKQIIPTARLNKTGHRKGS